MKHFLVFFGYLATIAVFSQTMDARDFIAYKHVAIIGVDGAGAFFKQAKTPNLDRIFQNGSITFSMLTSKPTISAQCWGSLLHGVSPEQHRLNNTDAAAKPYDGNSKYPSIFKVIRQVRPDAQLASFCCWKPINIGIVEDDIDVHKEDGADPDLTAAIVKYLENHAPVLLFVQLDQVDGAGHKNGYGTPAHLDAITDADRRIGIVYDKYKERGLIDDTLFIVVADHGGTPQGKHGGDSDAEKFVMFAAAGKNVQKGLTGPIEIRDIAAIAAFALGIKCPESWTARIPAQLFVGVEEEKRP